MKDNPIRVRPLSKDERDWVRRVMVEEWGGVFIVVHGEIFHPEELQGFVAEAEGEKAGLLTYRIHADECEVMTLNSWRPGMGIGSALLEEARLAAREAGCCRLYLVTTNNNLYALRFYQKRGFVISAVRLNALTGSRILKPGIPLLDEDGLPIRDEIELETLL